MKKILLVFPSFYPAYKSGGPVRSATNLIKLLKNKYVFDVFTADKDLGETEQFNNVNIDSWSNEYMGSNVYYSSDRNNSLLKIKSLFSKKKYDVVYLNSFFSYVYSIKFLILYKLGFIKCNTLILAPRGELTHGAMSLKSFKKKCYLFFFKLLGLSNGIKFHFTSEDEKSESLQFINSTNYIIAPNMHSELPSYRCKEKIKNELKILFLSRVSPKKNLLIAIDALSKITNSQVEFTIAGEIDDSSYWNRCEEKIKTLPANIRVHMIGAVGRERVSEELFNSHLFILPTLNENYGHAIVEAMMHSNIVLISDQTPWSAVDNNGGLVVYDNNVSSYTQKIEEVLLLDKIEFNKKTRNIYTYCDAILQSNITSINEMFE